MDDLHIVPLELSMVEELPHHSRVYAFWETDREPGHCERGYDDSFEKEAWLSAVLLEWGVCGQVLVADERAVGTVLYAPQLHSPPQIAPQRTRQPRCYAPKPCLHC